MLLIYTWNLSVSWACGERVLKSCTLMRIETLDDLFRTSSGKWICIFNTLCIPSTWLLQMQARLSCIQHAVSKSLRLTQKSGDKIGRAAEGHLTLYLWNTGLCDFQTSHKNEACKQSLFPWSTAEHCWQGKKLLLHSCNAHVHHSNCALTANSNAFL